jgi:hypothetical protein
MDIIRAYKKTILAVVVGIGAALAYYTGNEQIDDMIYQAVTGLLAIFGV